MATPLGSFMADYSERGLARLEFPDESHRISLPNPSPPENSEVRRWHALTTVALDRALSGRAPETFPPFDLSAGTEFQRRVWGVLRTIPPGATMSYAEVASAIGSPKATRAVGGACGANPIPVLIPCHRVLAVGGRLGGFSGGLNWKRRLLGIEGIIWQKELIAALE